MEKAMRDASSEARVRVSAARYSGLVPTVEAKVAIPVSCLHLGAASLLHLPAESFVEYQIAAQRERPGILVRRRLWGLRSNVHSDRTRSCRRRVRDLCRLPRRSLGGRGPACGARRALKFSV